MDVLLTILEVATFALVFYTIGYAQSDIKHLSRSLKEMKKTIEKNNNEKTINWYRNLFIGRLS